MIKEIQLKITMENKCLPFREANNEKIAKMHYQCILLFIYTLGLGIRVTFGGGNLINLSMIRHTFWLSSSVFRNFFYRYIHFMAEKYMKKGVNKSIVCDNKYLNIINTRLVKTIMVHLYNEIACDA